MSRSRLAVGFIPLVDCAPFVAAQECGFAAHEGLELRLVRESSWANIRDRLLIGHFDAVHLLGPMAIASTLGVGHVEVPIVAPMALGYGGNGVCVSKPLGESLSAAGDPHTLDPAATGAALRRVVATRAAAGQPPLVFAVVYPFSCHNYLLRYWLAANGVDPDRDVTLVVIPPPLLVDTLRARQIDGFCVGEPWSSLAVAEGAARLLLSANAIWPRTLDKVLGLRQAWSEAQPEAAASLVRAVARAARWCDDPGNHDDLARLLAGPRYVGIASELIGMALAGNVRTGDGAAARRIADYLVFGDAAAGVPSRAYAAWVYAQMLRWHQVAPSDDGERRACATMRPDLYRAAVAGVRPVMAVDEATLGALYDGSHAAPPHSYSAP